MMIFITTTLSFYVIIAMLLTIECIFVQEYKEPFLSNVARGILWPLLLIALIAYLNMSQDITCKTEN